MPQFGLVAMTHRFALEVQPGRNQVNIRFYGLMYLVENSWIVSTRCLETCEMRRLLHCCVKYARHVRYDKHVMHQDHPSLVNEFSSFDFEPPKSCK